MTHFINSFQEKKTEHQTKAQCDFDTLRCEYKKIWKLKLLNKSKICKSILYTKGIPLTCTWMSLSTKLLVNYACFIYVYYMALHILCIYINWWPATIIWFQVFSTLTITPTNNEIHFLSRLNYTLYNVSFLFLHLFTVTMCHS